MPPGALPSCILPRVARGDDVKLAYGERPDGSIVHISQVVSGLGCNCVCPGCRAPLVARKGKEKVHHFGHHRAVPCKTALESALHKLAKQVLDERRELLLPEVRAEIGDRELVTFAQELHRFDDAILEHQLDAIVPDVIVRKGKHRLLVEIFVTHRCDAAKIAKIRALGLSCVEIDLRRVSRQAGPDEVAAALVGGAPRHWVNNPKIDAATQQLEAKLADEAREAERAAERRKLAEQRRLMNLAGRLSRLRDQARPTRDAAPPSETLEDIRAHGFGHLVGRPLAGDFCFAVNASEWQAFILKRFLVDLLEQGKAAYTGFHATNVFQHLKDRMLLQPSIPTFYDPEAEAFLRQQVPAFRPPYRVVEAYLELLVDEGILRQSRKNWAIADNVERRWDEARKRRWQLASYEDLNRNMLSRIRSCLEVAERTGFSIDRWWAQPHPVIGISFEEAFASDDRRLPELSFVLSQLEAMFVRNGAIVDDLFDLPVAAARDRLIAARRAKAEEAERVAAAQALSEANMRVASLAAAAREALGADAVSWLENADERLGGISPETSARGSAGGLHPAQALLVTAARDLEAARGRALLRTKLLDLAGQSRRPDHAKLFLTSPNPAWDNRRPIEFCVDQRSFETLRKAMATVAA